MWIFYKNFSWIYEYMHQLHPELDTEMTFVNDIITTVVLVNTIVEMDVNWLSIRLTDKLEQIIKFSTSRQSQTSIQIASVRPSEAFQFDT